MRLDLSSLNVPANVPVVPARQNPQREQDHTPQTLASAGSTGNVPAVPVVPVENRNVYETAGYAENEGQYEEQTSWLWLLVLPDRIEQLSCCPPATKAQVLAFAQRRHPDVLQVVPVADAVEYLESEAAERAGVLQQRIGDRRP